MTFKKVLLAADGSAHALRTAEKAKALLKGSKGHVDIAYVLSDSHSRSDVLHHASKGEIYVRRRNKLKPIEQLFQTCAVSYTIHILHGERGPTIVEFANRESYDYIVLGSRRLNRVQRFVLGSVSHKVAKRVQAPVMIVK